MAVDPILYDLRQITVYALIMLQMQFYTYLPEFPETITTFYLLFYDPS
jgi:hypothetical protein